MMGSSGEGQPLATEADGDTCVAAALESPGSARASLYVLQERRDERKSLLRHSPWLVLLAILIADSNRRTDPDLWGHLRFGQEFIVRRHLIDRDPYSYSAPGIAWHDYEWLAEVVMAAVYNLGGVLGLKLWKFVCTAITVTFIVDAEAETGASFALQLPVLLLASLGLLLQMQFRPQMFTFALLAALLALLTRDNCRPRGAPLWLAIPLMLLWVNLHAGFFVGVIALVVYSLTATVREIASDEGWKRGAGRAAITIAAGAVTLVNPFGVAMWRAVARTLVQPYTRGAIEEWQPTLTALISQWRHGPSGIFVYLAFVLLVAGLAIAFIMSPSLRDLPLVAVAAVMSIGGWLSARNMALAVIAVPAPLVAHLNLLAQRRCGKASPAPESTTNRWVLIVLCAFVAIQGGLFSGRLALDAPYPAGAMEFMRDRGLYGNVLSEWGWGGYIIWHQAPRSKVFVDGRSDSVYPLAVIRDFLLFRFDLPGGARVLDSYPHDYVLIATSSPARRLMTGNHAWKLLYRDNDALLYARANASASKLTDRAVFGSNLDQGFP